MSLLFNTQPKNAASFYNGVITSSLRFNEVSNSRLDSPSFASDGGDTWTWSAWVKLNQPNTRQCLFGRAGNNAGLFFNDTVGTNQFQFNDDGAVVCTSPAKRRDASAWYHVTINGNGTINKLWVNGVQQTFDSNPNLGKINEAVVHYIGMGISTTYSYDGQIADVNFVDGTALDYTAFAEFNNGILIPIEPSVTYGDNGFRLQFKGTGTSANSSGMGADTSGNDSHFSVVNLNAHDVLTDNPENNFCTLNPNAKGQQGVLSEGNLKFVGDGGNNWDEISSTFAVSSGKWYWEVQFLTIQQLNSNIHGIRQTGRLPTDGKWYGSSTAVSDIGIVFGVMDVNGLVTNSSGSGTLSMAIAAEDIVQFRLDLDNNELSVSVDGTDKGKAWDITANIEYTPSGTVYNSSSVIYNFGQDSSFVGTETATSNADANGFGTFHSAVPSGYLALCSANLPEPTIGPNSDTVATDHFNTLLYTGNSTDDRAITGLGLKPDWVWIKKRASSNAMSHYIVDSARGTSNTSGNGTLGGLQSNGTEYEQTTTDGGFISFDNDGFTLGQAPAQGGYPNAGYERINKEDDTYVAWNWVANGGTATATISESGDNPAAVVQANPTAGFSIITYTGTGDAGTVAHGLGAVPQMIIIKNRDAADAWAVYHGRNTAAPATDYLVLNTTAGTADGAGYWADTAPTDSVFTVHDAHSVNADGEKYVAYVFAEIDGYSKFGVYTGNGIDVNGAFVYLGFRPAWIMTKVTSAANQWNIHDNKRNPDNSVNKFLLADQGVVENTGTGIKIDFMANGFRHADNGAAQNNAGVTYIYMAFAEQPFKYANAR